jgi:two-component system response regulator MprA
VSARLLVVDDEPAVRESLRRALVLEGYEVDLAADGYEALRRVDDGRPDAVLLDVLMPQLDGLATCRRLRAEGNRLPILVKPFALEELLARVRALLRRSEGHTGGSLRFADLELDPGAHEVRRGERAIELTRTEFALLELFLRNPRQVLTRSQIYERIWGYDFGPTSNALDVYIGYLRRKTEAGGEPRLIHTVRGIGYALREG